MVDIYLGIGLVSSIVRIWKLMVRGCALCCQMYKFVSVGLDYHER